jgi:hypothetical protein
VAALCHSIYVVYRAIAHTIISVLPNQHTEVSQVREPLGAMAAAAGAAAAAVSSGAGPESTRKLKSAAATALAAAAICPEGSIRGTSSPFLTLISPHKLGVASGKFGVAFVCWVAAQAFRNGVGSFTELLQYVVHSFSKLAADIYGATPLDQTERDPYLITGADLMSLVCGFALVLFADHIIRDSLLALLDLAARSESRLEAGLLTQGVPGVPQDPLAPRRRPLGSST